MIAPCHSLQPNGLHLISPCHHHHYHHHIDQRNGYDAFENYDQYGDACEADDDFGDGISATNQILLLLLFLSVIAGRAKNMHLCQLSSYPQTALLLSLSKSSYS